MNLSMTQLPHPGFRLLTRKHQDGDGKCMTHVIDLPHDVMPPGKAPLSLNHTSPSCPFSLVSKLTALLQRIKVHVTSHRYLLFFNPRS